MHKAREEVNEEEEKNGCLILLSSHSHIKAHEHV